MSDVITTVEEQTIVTETDSAVLVQTTNDNIVIEEGDSGPQGAPGPQGNAGPPGRDGIGDKYFRQDFNVSTELAINHGLHKRPSITVVDSAGDEVVVDVDYIDDDNVRLDLAGGFSGSVYCN